MTDLSSIKALAFNVFGSFVDLAERLRR